MRNFTNLLFISILLFSCSKNHEDMGSPGGNTPVQSPAKPAPVTKVTILINDTAMNITSLSFERHGTGTGGGMTITASNNSQKVTALVYNFYQNNPWGMIYTEEVNYVTRMDSLSDWNGTYTRPVPRDDQVRFDNFTPLSDSVVTGNFAASFYATGNSKEKKPITIKGNFDLVFVR